MLDVEQHTQESHNSLLAEWVARAIGLAGVSLITRLRENNLHIICESSQCPNAAIVVPKLLLALKATITADGLPTSPEQPIYQVILYGRATRSPVLDWIETIDINQLDTLLLQWLPHGVSLAAVSETPLGTFDRVGAGLDIAPLPQPTNPIQNPPAPCGEEEAIAQQVAEILSCFGSSIKVFIQQPFQAEKAETSSTTLSLSLSLSLKAEPKEEELDTHPIPPPLSPDRRRILVTGNCDSCPEESEIAIPVATRLRDLKLAGFSDAVIRFHIKASQTDWVLQVDLTPPEEMLLDWARWGDVNAIAHLLDRTLAQQDMQVRAVLKDSTLHLFCSLYPSPKPPLLGGVGGGLPLPLPKPPLLGGVGGGLPLPLPKPPLLGGVGGGLPLPLSTPDKETAISLISSMLESIAPAGIKSAVVYGVEASSGIYPVQESPVWIEWLNLPKSRHPDRAPTPIALAPYGDTDAIAFELQRLLNPDIDRRLATGGIHIALRREKDLLHIMTSAPVCPQQNQVCQAIALFCKERLKMPEIASVRVDGRRAGETEPVWNYEIDLVSSKLKSKHIRVRVRNIVAQSDSSPLSLARLALVQWLCSTHLFVGTCQLGVREKAKTSSSPSPSPSPSPSWVACVWGTVGLLLTLQADWLLGQKLRSSVIGHGSSVIGQTQVQDRQPSTDDLRKSFNSRLLDEKLALYKEACSTNGPPEILIVGSSRALRGIDPHALQTTLLDRGFTSVKIFNFGINGATAKVVDLLIRRLLTPNQLPKLIIWADGARAFNSGRNDITYNAIAASPASKQLSTNTTATETGTLTQPPQTQETSQTKKPHGSIKENYEAVDRSLNEKLARFSSTYPLRDRLIEQMLQQYAQLIPATGLRHKEDANMESPDTQENLDVDGFLPLKIRFDPSSYYQHHPRVSGDYDGDYESFHLDGEQDEALQALLKFVGQHQIPLVFVNLPLTDDYLDSVRKQNETQFQLYMEQLASQKKLIFLNMTQMWSTTYDYFSDPSHLNSDGAYAVSTDLAQQIMPLLPRS